MPQEFIVTLDKLVYGGKSLGRLPDGRAVFVAGALPGETVRLRLRKEGKRHAEADLLAVLTAAPQRITPQCPYFGHCGGCHYQHLPYPAQLQAKEAIFRDQLQRIGKLASPPVRPIVPAPHPWNYRNHIQFHQAADGRLGFMRADRPEVLPITTCLLPEAPIAAFWPQIVLDPLPALERLSLRADTYGDLMLTFYAPPEALPEVTTQAGISIAHVSQEEAIILAGDDHLLFRIHERDFRVSPGAFFQVNTPMAAALVTALLERVTLPVDTILDVYSGGGLFSAFLAPHCRQLVAVEASPAASEDFAFNLDEFDHISLYEAPAENVLPHLDLRPDLVVVDPPRSGLPPKVLDAIVRMAPQEIAYISCDPATLARDTARLQRQGYQLQESTPFDLFPQTYHIESLSLFRPQRIVP